MAWQLIVGWTWWVKGMAALLSDADTELIYSGRYSPNLLAAALAVVAGCMVHYCNLTADCGSLAMLFAAGIFFFGLGGVAAKELHEAFSVQAALIAAALMAAVAGGLVPVTKSKSG
eukprot:s2057_g6.t1